MKKKSKRGISDLPSNFITAWIVRFPPLLNIACGASTGDPREWVRAITR